MVNKDLNLIVDEEEVELEAVVALEEVYGVDGARDVENVEFEELDGATDVENLGCANPTFGRRLLGCK